MRYLFPLGLCVLLLGQGAHAFRPLPGHVIGIGGAETGDEISGEEAIRLAKKRAARRYKPLKRYNVVVCDVGRSWRVIFELKDPRTDGRGPEYTVYKRGGGEIIHVLEAPHRLPARGGVGAEAQESKAISREEAVALAKEDALRTYGPIDELDVNACELIGSWYIAFSFKNPLMRGGPPLYIIDKKTGKIIENRFSA